MTSISKLLIKLIQTYQIFIKPLLLNKPHCRFQITCSQYGIHAISQFGILKGIGKILIRILKCHPFTLKTKNQ